MPFYIRKYKWKHHYFNRWNTKWVCTRVWWTQRRRGKWRK